MVKEAKFMVKLFSVFKKGYFDGRIDDISSQQQKKAINSINLFSGAL